MLAAETALRKDRNAAPAAMQHRHFATIAAIIADMPNDFDGRQHITIAHLFADRLAETNDRFDRARFLRACGV